MKFVTNYSRTLAAFSGVVALSMTFGCTSAKSPQIQKGERLAETAVDPAPQAKDVDTIASQLKRFRGQTSFLSPNAYSGLAKAEGREFAPSPMADSVGGARAQQDSDVFKIGNPGSKLLYLLNSYRGLQVVSFKDGVEQPKILGRVNATGNWPSEMYFDSANSRLFVLENVYSSNGGVYGEQSRIVVYDVSDPAKPVISDHLDVAGTVADSRIVGNVLYVATSDRGYYGQSNPATPKGRLYSFSMKKAGLTQVQEADLILPVSARENMQIVEVKNGDAYQYYLIAALSQNTWGWWDTKSSIEVVDISDADGAIKPLMNVASKGFITKRNQTFIKNNTLIVTSNYIVDNGDKSLARVAVETFGLPTATSEILSEKEANYRKVVIDHKIDGLIGDTKDAQLKALLADKDVGLLGRFVRDANGKLNKPVADSTVTTGDTSGLSASLQDVRYVGDRLYAFWAQAAAGDPLRLLGDPFDLFDISHPEAGVTYLKRLQYDGWVTRSFPVSFQGHDYVVGLGWLVQNVNNEDNRRQIQARLFEIKGNRLEDVADLALAATNGWARLNGQDKEIEFRLDSSGKGVIMFQASFWDATTGYNDGGKLIGVNLAEAVAGKDDVFQEGSLLSGNPGWLKRVFTNTEIDRVNTFSDQALGTYNVQNSIGVAGKTEQAIGMLELARNIRGYQTLPGGKLGVQIISDYGWFGTGDVQKTKLRLVSTDKADTEVASVLSEAVVDGSYVTMKQTSVGDILIASRSYKQDAQNVYYTINDISRVTLVDGKLTVANKVEWKDVYNNPRPDGTDNTALTLDNISINGGAQFIDLDASTVAYSWGRGVKVFPITDIQSAKDVQLQNCVAKKNAWYTLENFSGKLYLSYQESVDDETRKGLRYNRNLLMPVAVSANGWTCGNPIVIPGKPVAVLGDSHLVTDDVRLLDIVTETYPSSDPKNPPETYYRAVTERNLISLKIADGKASLVDLYQPDHFNTSAMQLFGSNGFVFVENFVGDSYYRPMYRGMTTDRMIMPPWTRNQPTEVRLVFLSFDDQQFFRREVHVPSGLKLTDGVSLAAVVADPDQAGSYLAALTSGSNVQVLGWSEKDREPSIKKLSVLDAAFNPSNPDEIVRISASGWYGYGSSGVHFTPELRSLEFPAGFSGISQVLISK